MEEKIEGVLQNLNQRNIKAKFFKTKEDVTSALLQEIKPDMTVGIGGSMTIKELGIYQALVDGGNKVYWHWMTEPEEVAATRTKASTADLYLTSTNALTEGGELVNIDGIGNRVASMFYGPKRTIVVCGINKITPDLISAIDRIKRDVSVRNARRLNLETPCVESGQCDNCHSSDKICNVMTVISGKPGAIDLNVYIVGEELGY